jgi:hypothetical protein
MLVCIGGILLFRYLLSSSPRQGSIFYAAVVFNSIAISFMLTFVGAHVEGLLKSSVTVCSWLLSIVPFHVEDLIASSVILSSSLNLLFVTVGLIGNENLSSYGSNNGGDMALRIAQAVPLEQVVLTYIGSFVLPIAIGATSKKGILMTWLISLCFLIAIEVEIYSHVFPYLAVCSHLFLLGALYEVEKNKIIIYNSYKVADKTAGESIEREKKERVFRKKEEIDRKLNEALLHAMVPRKVAEKLKAGGKVMPEEFPEVINSPDHRMT